MSSHIPLARKGHMTEPGGWDLCKLKKKQEKRWEVLKAEVAQLFSAEYWGEESYTEKEL